MTAGAADGMPDAAGSPVKPVPGYQAVVDFLRREIILGRIRPGDRLPPERRLSEQLGVARETLRQALRVLEGSGQVSIQRGARGGAVVQEALVDPRFIRDDVVMRADEILALAEFRSVVDAAAARFAAERRSAADLAQMDDAQAELAAATTLHDSRLADTAFHLAVARASRNPEIARAVEDARVKMFGPVDLLSFRFHRESSIDGHARVLEAIRERDPERAAEEMRKHLTVTRQEFEQLLSDKE